MSNPIDFFVHVPKTAGTTMQQIIDEQYAPHEILDFHRKPGPDVAERIARMGPEKRIFLGHINSSFRENAPRPCRPFAMLRDATERIISYYYFVGREPSHPLHGAFHRGELSIERLAREQGSIQARYVAGYRAKPEVPAAQLLQEAKYNLEHVLVTFGLTERFDESLILFNHALGWNVKGYARANVTRNRPKPEQLPPEAVATIREHNQIDAELYAFAQELFERRIASQPAGFAEELAELQRGKRVAEGVSRLRKTWSSIWRSLGLSN